MKEELLTDQPSTIGSTKSLRRSRKKATDYFLRQAFREEVFIKREKPV